MHANTVVSIQPCQDYSMDLLKEAITNSFEPFGGIHSFIKAQDRVLVKPNLLKPARPDQAVTTHPLFIQALLELCLDLRGKPVIGDSPGFYSLNRVAEETGLKRIAEELGVPIIEFKRPVSVKSLHSGKTLKHFKLDQLVMESHVIINVPKLKAHQQLIFTGAIKNLYGCIPGKRKAKYHYQFGDRDNLFAEMLVENYQLVRPAFNLVDGIVVMEGNGPACGTPRHLGIVIAGRDGIAVDRIICEILGIPFDRVLTLKAAQQMNAGTTHLNQITVLGTPLDKVRVSDFVQANPMPIKFQFWRVIRSVLRNLYYRHFKERKSEGETVLQ